MKLCVTSQMGIRDIANLQDQCEVLIFRYSSGKLISSLQDTAYIVMHFYNKSYSDKVKPQTIQLKMKLL